MNTTQWKIATLEAEIKRCEELLTKHRSKLTKPEVEYFEECKKKLEMDLVEIAILEPGIEDE